MDTNMVMPTGPGSCTVVYDYYLDTAEIGRLGDQVVGAALHTVHNMYREKALVGAFSVITNLRMELFGALGTVYMLCSVQLCPITWSPSLPISAVSR